MELDMNFPVHEWMAMPYENSFNHDVVSNYYEKEVIDKYYAKYLENLKQLAWETLWLPISDIEIHRPNGWMVLDDRYLYSTMRDPASLGKDIVRNGTYWCVIVEQQENGKYILKDGAHRVYSLKYLQSIGELPEDFKMLCIDLSKRKTPSRGYRACIPRKEEVSDLFKRTYPTVFEHADYSDGDEFGYLTDSTYDFHAVQLYSLLLRNSMFEYKQKTGESYPSDPIINNEEAWGHWYNAEVQRTAEEWAIFTMRGMQTLYNGYIENIKRCPWLNRQIGLDDVVLTHTRYQDRFVDACDGDLTLLARDMLKYGTYHPIYLIPDKEGQLIVTEGGYRYTAMQELAKVYTELHDVSFYGIEVPHSAYNYKYDKSKKLGTPVPILLPNWDEYFAMMDKHPEYHKFGELVQSRSKVEIVDRHLYRLELYTEWEYITAMQTFCEFLNRIMHKANDDWSVRLEGAQFLNVGLAPHMNSKLAKELKTK